MQEGTQDDGARLTQLADFWLYEHLLSLPKSIASDEIIEHLGAKFPYREVEGASLPAPISARLFLRHLRHEQLPITDWDEQLQLLGLMCQISCKQAQFRSRAVAIAMNPPTELLIEVLLQLLCVQSDPGYRGEGDCPLQPLTSTTVASAAELLLSNADVAHLLDDELLQNRLSLLEQLLRGRLEPAQLQQHLRQAFPSDAVEEQLREYADKAWAALGQTSLQRYQIEVLAGRLPWDPMQHFAALLPVETQAALDAAAFAADADIQEAEPPQQQKQQRQTQHARGTRPVVLLGEATAPVLGELEDLEAAAGSSQGEHAGRGSRQQQVCAAAGASPRPKASPMAKASAKQAKAAAIASPAAAAGGGAVDAGKHSRKARATHGSKSSKDAKQEAVRPSRKQLQLEPSNAAGAAAAANSDAYDLAAAAAVADGGKGGRKSRKQQQQQQQQQQTESFVESEVAAPAAAAGNENMPPPAAAVAGSVGRRRGRKALPVEEAAAAGLGSSEEQTRDSSQPNVIEGVELAPAAQEDAAATVAAGGAQGKSTAAGFLKVFSKPLDGLAAAAGGIAAAVRGSPARGGPKERKMCGAPQEGVKSRTVPWESPFGCSIDSPEDTARDKSAKSALKRKRAQADGDRGRAAAARAAARGADSGNTEYQDAQEEAGPDSEGAPARGSPRRQQHQQDDDDSSIDDPESEEGWSQNDESDCDDSSDDEQGEQQQQRRRLGRPRKDERQQQRKPGRPPGAAATAAAAGGRAGGAGTRHGGGAGARAAAYDPDFDAFEERGGPKKRRKFNRWSAEEEELLIQLVAEQGEGQWALIHQLGGDGFNRRTQVDLKDKWRNLKKKGAGSD